MIWYETRRDCSGFRTWLYWSWRFVNRFKVREIGTRILGVTFCNWRDP